MDQPAERTRVPLHRRSVVMDAFTTDDPDVIEVIGTFCDERPWVEPPHQDVIHRMTLTLQVQLSTLTIVGADAQMLDFPHVECPQIAPSFAGLVGLSIAKGYNKEVQRRFIGVSGCTHLEFLARAMGPAVIQASASRRAQQRILEGHNQPPQVTGYMKNTCHVWADDGPAIAKIDAGWTPGLAPMPTPGVVEIRRLVAQRDAEATARGSGARPTSGPDRPR
jgi:hypothetical protein